MTGVKDQPALRGYVPHTYWSVEGDQSEQVMGGVIEETTLSIRVNGSSLATIMCSPIDLETLALGFLYNEGVLRRYTDVQSISTDPDAGWINIQTHRRMATLRRHMILTAGCGGGVTFQQLSELRGKVETDYTTIPDVILARMRDLQGAARLYNTVRGIHTALLGDESGMIYSAEDVGRHNTVDKIAGMALQDEFDASHSILLTSGRISSEMIGKANRLNIPIVASRTAPTSISVELADAWDICLAGYVRRGSFRVYTHPYRLRLEST